MPVPEVPERGGPEPQALPGEAHRRAERRAGHGLDMVKSGEVLVAATPPLQKVFFSTFWGVFHFFLGLVEHPLGFLPKSQSLKIQPNSSQEFFKAGAPS